MELTTLDTFGSLNMAQHYYSMTVKLCGRTHLSRSSASDRLCELPPVLCFRLLDITVYQVLLSRTYTFHGGHNQSASQVFDVPEQTKTQQTNWTSSSFEGKENQGDPAEGGGCQTMESFGAGSRKKHLFFYDSLVWSRNQAQGVVKNWS